MTGGFYDHRRSKLKFMTNIIQSQNLIKVKEGELREVEQLKQDIANANKQKELYSKAREKKEKSIADVRTQIDQLKASMDVKQAEMGTEISNLKQTLITCRTNRVELETNLTTNLKRRKQELEAIISSPEDDALHSDAELKAQELQDAKSLVEVAKKELESECPFFSAIHLIQFVCTFKFLP
ncbi:Structural maintenance of chromosomes protein 3 [Linum perenne]